MNGITYRKPEELKDSGIEWLGNVPKEWVIKKTVYLADIITGITPSKQNEQFYEGGEIPWVKPDNLQENFSVSETKEMLTFEGAKYARLIPPESTMVCCIGTIGKVGKNRIPSTTNQQINSIIFSKPDVWLNSYGIYAIISAKDEYLKCSTKVVISILNRDNQGRVKMPCPKLFEQQKISNFLDFKTSQFDSIIQKKEQLIQELEEAKRSLISEVVTGKVKVVDGELVERDPSEMKESGIEWVG